MNNVNHPKHYQSKHMEVIDIIEAFMLNFSLGSAIKYIIRSGRKNKHTQIEDLEKAKWFIDREIARLQKVREKQSKPIQFKNPYDRIANMVREADENERY